MSYLNPIPRGTRQVFPDYVCDGVTRVFPYTFWVNDIADLSVEYQSMGSILWVKLSSGTDFIATNLGLPNGGNLTTSAVFPAGTLLRVTGMRIPNRITSVVNNGIVSAPALEKELDLITVTMQEIRRDLSKIATGGGPALDVLLNNQPISITTPGASFYSDTGGGAPKVSRLKGDRFFLGPVSTFGAGFNNSKVDPTLTPEAKALHDWAYRDGSMLIESALGSMSIVGLSQSSNNTLYPGQPTYQPSCISISGFSINDDPVFKAPAWGGYFEAVRFANRNFTVGIEVAVANLGSMTVITPSNTKSGALKTAGIWLQSGAGLDGNGYNGSFGAVNHADAALVVLSSYANNSVKFGKGIVFSEGSLVDLSAGSNVFEPLTMPTRHQLTWYRSNNVLAGYVWHDGTGTGTSGITLSDQVVKIAGTFGLQADFLTVEANFYSRMNVGNPTIQVSANSNLFFNRANNDFHFVPNGVDVLQINQFSANLSAGKVLAINGVQVLAAQRTGWGLPVGAPSRASFNTATVTVPQLASVVAAIISDLSLAAGGMGIFN